MQERVADPGDPETFRRSILDERERTSHPEAVALHRDLLAFCAALCLPMGQCRSMGRCWVRVLATPLFPRAGRRFPADRQSRPRPTSCQHTTGATLIARPPQAGRGAWIWSSENPDYGGGGMFRPFRDGMWHFPGHAAIALAPGEAAGPRAFGRETPNCLTPARCSAIGVLTRCTRTINLRGSMGASLSDSAGRQLGLRAVGQRRHPRLQPRPPCSARHFVCPGAKLPKYRDRRR